MLYLILGIALSIFTWSIVIYNKLISSSQLNQEAWSGIDVQLKRRIDLIPNLIECVKGYMSHEKETLESLTELRNH